MGINYFQRGSLAPQKVGFKASPTASFFNLTSFRM